MHSTVCNTLLRTGSTLLALFTAAQLYAAPGATPLDWDDMDGNGNSFNSFFAGYTNTYDLRGRPLADAEQSGDPTNGGTGVGSDIIDIASGKDGTNDATGNCNGDQGTETCGEEPSTYYHYLDIDNDPSTLSDNYILLRMRMVGDPSANANNDGGWSSQHWNFLVSTVTDTVDDNGTILPIGYDFKEYWLDIHGGDATLRVIYENANQQDLTGDPETLGLVMDEFVSCAKVGSSKNATVNFFLDDTEDGSKDCDSLSFTRVIAAAEEDGDGADSDNYWVDLQLPVTSLIDVPYTDPSYDPVTSLTVSKDTVYRHFYSTSNSVTDPLQKDYITDCITTSETWTEYPTDPANPITYVGIPCEYGDGRTSTTRDYGDALPVYGEAGHDIPTSGTTLFLGSVTPDNDGGTLYSLNADGDDTIPAAGPNDEDGVTPDLNNGNWTASSLQSFTVVSSAGGTLGVWLDWNSDGDFADTGEFSQHTVVAGSNTIDKVTVGADFDWTTDDLFGRFRLMSSGAVAPGGSLDAADFEGVASDGEVEDYKWNGFSSLPVTIAYLNAVPRSNKVLLEWSTATETSNVGFNVYAVVNGEWLKINDDMLPGSLDSLEPQHYQADIDNPYGKSLQEIGIAGVDVNGIEDRHGPYAVGKVRGKRPFAEKIDWKQVRKDMKAGLNARKARKASVVDGDKNINKGDEIHVDVEKTGLYKITDQDLRAAGLVMPGIDASEIALSFRGAAVARHIGGLNKKGEWNGKSWIEFIAEAPAGRDAVYLNANRYQLSRDASLVLDAPAFNKPEVAPARFEANNRYAFTIPSEDPWYDAKFYAIGTGRPGSLSRSFDLPGLQDGEAELMIYSSALSQGTHHMIVELNGTVIDDVQTEGWTPWVVTIPVSSSQLEETGNVLTLTLPGDSSDFDYVLYDKLEVSYPHSGKAETLSAGLQRAEKVSRNSLSRGRADLLVIAHPALMGEVLDGYIAERNAEGWNPKLVDVFDIYQAYGYGMATPSAITDYLDDARDMGYTHVQLVGAASYDYRDNLGLGSVNFIPSIYQRTAGIINYTPCDSCLVMDESLKPAAAIGRWPVHSPAELQAVINKSRAWANGQAAAHTFTLIADGNDEKNDFVSQVEETTKQLLETDGWNEPARVYLDDAIAAAAGNVDAGVAAAKADLITALEAGASITVFSGHGAPSTWSFKGLLKQQDIAGIQNAGKPTLALPLTCYTTYAESPYTSSLAHQLIAAGDNAAVAVYGAATLSSFRHNSEMGKRVISGLLEDQTLGESIMNGKLDLNSSYRDVILNSNLLGDVTLKLQ